MEEQLRVSLQQGPSWDLCQSLGTATPASRQVEQTHSTAFAFSHSRRQLRVKGMFWILLLSAAPHSPWWHHCPAQHQLGKAWKEQPWCDNKAEESKHALQVALAFSLFLDRVKPRKDHVLSVVSLDYNLLGFFQHC